MARPSNWELASHVGIRDLWTSSDGCSLPAFTASISKQDAASPSRGFNREQQIRKAVLLSFTNTVPGQIEQLMQLSSREWKRLLHWLDVSGLALYLLDRFLQLGLLDTLPQLVVDDLQQRMKDNARRTWGMMNESAVIQLKFQEAGLRYAVMKGASLSPSSVPRPELRHQFDLDFLVAEKGAPHARRILEQRGYRLYAISGKTWEFKINETPNVSVKDLYKDLPYRAVELHLEADIIGLNSRINSAQYREIFGVMMPVFSPNDLFLGQAAHAFKDVCSSFSRTAHLLELYRHVLSRREDDTFWCELRARVENDRATCLGLGVVTYLITSIMGDFAPKALTTWTVEVLPPSMHLWVDLYGRHTALGKHPGTKLYLLLQRELEIAGVSTKTPVKRLLWPSRPPPVVIRPSPNESFSTRISRYRIQTRFIFSRFCFHIAEGLRYAIESYRWRRHLDRLSS